MMASTYLSSPKWKTLPFSVLEFTGEYSSNYAVQFAVMALTAAPAVIVYIILNKHITKGVAMGAVKGYHNTIEGTGCRTKGAGR